MISNRSSAMSNDNISNKQQEITNNKCNKQEHTDISVPFNAQSSTLIPDQTNKLDQDQNQNQNQNGTRLSQGKDTHNELAAASALAGLGKGNTSPDEDADDFEIPQRYTKSGRKKATPFPIKLLKVLATAEYSDVITWMPHGKSFMICQPKVFVLDILPTHFKQAKYSSFTRKLHRWGFQRHLRGNEAGAYFHNLFQRGRLDLVEKMSCHNPDHAKNPTIALPPAPTSTPMPLLAPTAPPPPQNPFRFHHFQHQNNMLTDPIVSPALPRAMMMSGILTESPISQSILIDSPRMTSMGFPTPHLAPAPLPPPTGVTLSNISTGIIDQRGSANANANANDLTHQYRHHLGPLFQPNLGLPFASNSQGSPLVAPSPLVSPPVSQFINPLQRNSLQLRSALLGDRQQTRNQPQLLNPQQASSQLQRFLSERPSDSK
mmetsp:Transcript_30479/g.43222  ORF Transcript_30479/g.43222 Transcript_30479/m.43222 type:complete len:432 (+) Transcript_30479:262-1557(+)